MKVVEVDDAIRWNAVIGAVELKFGDEPSDGSRDHRNKDSANNPRRTPPDLGHRPNRSGEDQPRQDAAWRDGWAARHQQVFFGTLLASIAGSTWTTVQGRGWLAPVSGHAVSSLGSDEESS